MTEHYIDTKKALCNSFECRRADIKKGRTYKFALLKNLLNYVYFAPSEFEQKIAAVVGAENFLPLQTTTDYVGAEDFLPLQSIFTIYNSAKYIKGVLCLPIR